MIKFSSFKEAINYQPVCPLCRSQLHINDRDLAADYGFEYRGDKRERISFFVNRREDDTPTIDPETDEVELLYANRMPPSIPNYNSPTHYTNPPKAYNGRFLHALTIDCKSCCQYGFTLQLHFDLTEQKLASAFLNSETVNITECEMVHEIKNIYATEKTHYTYFPRDGSCKQTTLPLIALDLSNPLETVARIRKLLIFS